MIKTLRLSAAALCISVLAGCAAPAATDKAATERTAGQWEQQMTEVKAFDSWTLTGKVGLRTPEETNSANLDWLQTPYYYRLLVTGPLGAGRSTLEGREGRFSLTNSEGRFEAETPEALMEQRLGWSLPVSQLTTWVRGLPVEGQPHTSTEDNLGFPATLSQDGWKIDYRGWMNVDGVWLPNRMVMTYGDIRATLVVNQWQAGEGGE
uniref:lipoprotein insertase outer membrane protein LolB n=1 Tax=Halomonas sp. TaxID=1486246 RepID=UPI00263066EA|nr:lipoprotein insertase outer membrane protein LolB [Halomonas sp.]